MYPVIVGSNCPMISVLECEPSVLLSIHSSGELIGCITWTDKMPRLSGHYGLGWHLIHEFQESASVGQHDLWIKHLIKGNAYL